MSICLCLVGHLVLQSLLTLHQVWSRCLESSNTFLAGPSVWWDFRCTGTSIPESRPQVIVVPTLLKARYMLQLPRDTRLAKGCSSRLSVQAALLLDLTMAASGTQAALTLPQASV